MGIAPRVVVAGGAGVVVRGFRVGGEGGVRFRVGAGELGEELADGFLRGGGGGVGGDGFGGPGERVGEVAALTGFVGVGIGVLLVAD